MRSIQIAGLLFLSASLLAAQNRGPAKLKSSQVFEVSPPASCPLNMRVQQGVGGTMMATDKNGAQVEMFAARLKLLLNDNRPDRTSQRMINARVSVRGWTGKGQILPAGAIRDKDQDLARMTLTVPLAGGGLPEASGDLLLPGFTAASMVELESITFDDGDVWSISGACHAAPDLYMPVDSGK